MYTKLHIRKEVHLGFRWLTGLGRAMQNAVNTVLHREYKRLCGKFLTFK